MGRCLAAHGTFRRAFSAPIAAVSQVLAAARTSCLASTATRRKTRKPSQPTFLQQILLFEFPVTGHATAKVVVAVLATVPSTLAAMVVRTTGYTQVATEPQTEQ